MTDEFYRRYLDENLDRMLEDVKNGKGRAVQQVPDVKDDKTDETSALQPASSGIICSPAYASVEWMPKKMWVRSFNAGLKKLKKKGYERYPRPDEFFSLIIDYIESRLTGSLRDVAEDMLHGNGEWLSMAVERKGDVLVCYVDPKNLQKRAGLMHGYYFNELIRYSDRKEFDIKGVLRPLPYLPELVTLDNIDDGLVRFLYGRSFSELPESIQKRNPAIYLPKEGYIYPISHGIKRRCSTFSIDYNCYGACRGVRDISYIEKSVRLIKY